MKVPPHNVRQKERQQKPHCKECNIHFLLQSSAYATPIFVKLSSSASITHKIFRVMHTSHKASAKHPIVIPQTILDPSYINL